MVTLIIYHVELVCDPRQTTLNKKLDAQVVVSKKIVRDMDRWESRYFLINLKENGKVIFSYKLLHEILSQHEG
jgi:hypothetical protein